MVGIGNGLGGHPRDVSNDNNSIFLGDKLEKQRVVVVHTGESSDPHARRYLLAVEAKIKSSGKIIWLGATHLNRGVSQAFHASETTVLLAAARDAGVDLRRLILGLDANDSAPASEAGVRQAARFGFNLVDWRDVLSDSEFRGDSWNTFTGKDADVEKAGVHIDLFLVGSMIKITYGQIVPVKNGASDHHLLLADISV
jgi:hypothetical protein